MRDDHLVDEETYFATREEQLVAGLLRYPTPIPVTEQAVKSAFELALNATLPNEHQVLTGGSWSGLAPIRRVDISTDAGLTWRPARLRGPNVPHAWVRWEYPWRPPGPGSYTLQARATDWAGRTQPATVPFNTLGYLFWASSSTPSLSLPPDSQGHGWRAALADSSVTATPRTNAHPRGARPLSAPDSAPCRQ